MSRVGTAWYWPPDERVCPLRPGWAAAFLSLRRVPCGLPRAGRRGVLCGASTGHCTFASLFSGGTSGQLVTACETSFSARCGCRLRKGLTALLSKRAPPPRAVLVITCAFLPVPPLWGRTPEEPAPLPLSLRASVRSELA